MGKVNEIVRMNTRIGIKIHNVPVYFIEIMPSMSVPDIKRLAYLDNLMELIPAVLLQAKSKNLTDDGYRCMQLQAEVLAPVEQSFQLSVLHSPKEDATVEKNSHFDPPAIARRNFLNVRTLSSKWALSKTSTMIPRLSVTKPYWSSSASIPCSYFLPRGLFPIAHAPIL
jgi:hypothetical protein